MFSTDSATGSMLDVYVARQPIFDLENGLAGYELLYRRAAGATVAAGATRDVMAADVLVRSVLDFGLDPLVGNVPAFLNFTREALLEENYRLLDPSRVVIELMEQIRPDDEAFAACDRLRALGFRIALDDFEYEPAWERFLPLVDIVKIRVLDRDFAEVADAAQRLWGAGVTLLAEQVEAESVQQRCREVGFSLFQGFFFARPQVMGRRELSLDQISVLRLVQLLRDPLVSDAAIEELIRDDVPLSYRLLRIVNSATVGGRGIESIGHALRIVGRAELSRWMALLLVSAVSVRTGAERELARTAIQRARFCESLATAAGRNDEEAPLFLVGLLSLLDSLLGLPMEEILARLDLSPSVRGALLRTGGAYAPFLDLAESYERGRWSEMEVLAATVNVPATRVGDLYRTAHRWTVDRGQLAAA